MTKILDRSAPLPEMMQGRWVDIDESSSELLIEGSEITCFGQAVQYDFKEVDDDDGATTISLRVDDEAHEDNLQRANITGLVWTPEGEFHAYNTRLTSQFVRPAA